MIIDSFIMILYLSQNIHFVVVRVFAIGFAFCFGANENDLPRFFFDKFEEFVVVAHCHSPFILLSVVWVKVATQSLSHFL